MSRIASTIIEVCIFCMKEGKAEYLLLRRAPDEKLYPGIWQFISGSIEEGETAVDAALREMSEETGLVPEAFWVVPRVLSFYDPEWDSLNLVPFFAARVPAGSLHVLSSEHVESGWFSYSEARGKLTWPEWQDGIRIVDECIVSGKDVPRLTRLR
jgi:dihydroneopterin triphosphate diphosphatase